jgi:hypothetical protein
LGPFLRHFGKAGGDLRGPQPGEIDLDKWMMFRCGHDLAPSVEGMESAILTAARSGEVRSAA